MPLINDGPRIQQWMHDRSKLPIQKEFHGIAQETNGKIIAAFGYDSFQPEACQLHVCADPAGISKALLWRAFQVPFVQWNYRTLLGIIQQDNAKSLRIAKRLGFVHFGTAGGLQFFKMDREDCRWLRLLSQ